MHPPPSPGWADFTIMMKCTPETGYFFATLCVLCGFRGQNLCLSLFCSGAILMLLIEEHAENKKGSKVKKHNETHGF